MKNTLRSKSYTWKSNFTWLDILLF